MSPGISSPPNGFHSESSNGPKSDSSFSGSLGDLRLCGMELCGVGDDCDAGDFGDLALGIFIFWSLRGEEEGFSFASLLSLIAASSTNLLLVPLCVLALDGFGPGTSVAAIFLSSTLLPMSAFSEGILSTTDFPMSSSSGGRSSTSSFEIETSSSSMLNFVSEAADAAGGITPCSASAPPSPEPSPSSRPLVWIVSEFSPPSSNAVSSMIYGDCWWLEMV
mmetsp:Transcript_3677/g.8151  ORF Transcript_3677/g.8151 Transcript_3677/m.8151 type:complete len:220 (+) Transcript_3677:2013-2672(+)